MTKTTRTIWYEVAIKLAEVAKQQGYISPEEIEEKLIEAYQDGRRDGHLHGI